MSTVLLSVIFLTCQPAVAESPEIKPIKIGMSTALSGPLRDVGHNMRIGVETLFMQINKQNGVHGRPLQLIVRNDRYEPKHTGPNMRRLIEKDMVLAVIGNVGTPTSIVSLPIIKEKQVLLFGAMTGAGILRDKKYHNCVLNYRASYAQETAEMISGLIKMGIKPNEIAFFTQRDSYGQSGFQGASNALKTNGFDQPETLAHGRYTRNSLNVENAVAALLNQTITPRAVIMVGSYAPSAKFIKLAKQELPDLIFLNVSFVGSNALVTALGDDAEGVIITEVVPDYTSDLPIAIEYRNALAEFSNNVQPGFVSFEGYITAKIFVHGLQNAGKNLNHKTLTNSIRNLNNLDIGLGVNISFKEGGNQAINKIWPMIYQDKKFRPFNWTPTISSPEIDNQDDQKRLSTVLR